MQYGIYYAYWETECGCNFVPYVEKCARLGFDVLEGACGVMKNMATFAEAAIQDDYLEPIRSGDSFTVE